MVRADGMRDSQGREAAPRRPDPVLHRGGNVQGGATGRNWALARDPMLLPMLYGAGLAPDARRRPFNQTRLCPQTKRMTPQPAQGTAP